MDKFVPFDPKDFTWQLIVALSGAVFAVFSIMYNDYYIYYGLITFAFGVCTHIILIFLEWIFGKGKMNPVQNKNYWIVHLSNIIFTIVWAIVIISVYHPWLVSGNFRLK